MTAPAVNSSPSDRPTPSPISPSPCSAWATNLGLHLNVLYEHIRFSAPELYGRNSGELVSTMKSAAETVSGAAALKAARAGLAPFAELYAHISSVQGHGNTPTPHIITQISPETRNAQRVKQRHSPMFLTLDASYSSGCASLVLARLPP